MRRRVLAVVLIVGVLVVTPLAATLPAGALSAPNSNPTDLDIAFRDTSDNLKYVDDSGNVVDTGADADDVGGVGDIDGDGDLDVAFEDTPNANLKYIDDSGNIVDTGAQAFDLGGVADIDGDGDLDIVFSDINNNVKYIDDSGNVVDTGGDGFTIGGVGDIDSDGDLDIVFRDTNNNLKYVDDSGNVVNTGADARVPGGVADIDGDGDLDIAFRDTSDNLKYVDDSGNVVNTGADALDVGGIADVDFDGDLDIAFSDTNNNLKYIDDSGNVVTTAASSSDGVGGVGDIDDDGVFFKPPTVDNSTADPSGGVNISAAPVTLSIDVSDDEFSSGDQVTVEFINNGQTVGTDTLTTNRTASISLSTILAGKNEWYAVATDSGGNSQRTQNFTFNAPEAIKIRNASTPSNLITGSNNEVTVKIFQRGSDRVIQRNTTSGSISLVGVPAAPPDGYEVVVESDGDFTRRTVVIQSLLQQQEVYLLPTNGTSRSQVEFQIDDRTGEFSDDPTLVIERPIRKDFDGDGSNETRTERVVGRPAGAAGTVTTVLENEVRYQLRLRNNAGDTRVLGGFTPTRAQTVTLEVGELSFDVREGEDRTFNASARLVENQQGNVTAVRFNYRDPSNSTSKLNVTIRTLDGRQLGTARALNGPYGRFSLSEPVSDPENNTYVVEFNATVDGQVASGQLRPGVNQLPPGIPLKTGLKNIFAVGLILMVGGLFSAANARVGAVVTPLFAGGLWVVNWLPSGVTVFAIAIALGVGIIVNYSRRAS